MTTQDEERGVGDPGEEDRRLMVRVQGGDENAMGVIMERWERPVKSLISRIVLNASEAEELAQETFVRVWQQRDKFRKEAVFRPWIFAIAINLGRNRLRWWRTRPSVELQEWTSTAGEVEEGRVALERAERSAAVCEAIAALPLELREAIVLSEYERLSHSEIAVAVGATPKAVETRIYRAREKLRVSLRNWV